MMANQQESYRQRARQRAIERALRASHPQADGPTSMTSYRQRLNRQRGLAGWFWDLEPDFFVSVNSNDPNFTYARGRTAIRELDALIDRHVLGRNWCEFHSPERTLIVAIPEWAGGELHYHLLVKLPPKAQQEFQMFRDFGRRLTKQIQRKKIFPKGDAKVDQLVGNGETVDSLNQLKAACYVAKDLWREDNASNVIVSNEFHPTRRVAPAGSGDQGGWATS